MRILHIIETLNLGGAEKIVADLCNIMSAENEVVLCCIKETGVTASKLSPRVRIDCLEKRDGNQLGFVPRVARYIRSVNPDTVHLHSLGALLEVAVAMLFSPCPLFVTCHGHLSHYPASLPKRKLRALLEIPAFLSARGIVTVSQEVNKLLPPVVSGRAHTIYNGVQLPSAPPAPTAPGDQVDLVFAGRLAGVKNLASVIRALKLAEQRTRAKLCFHILGEGPEGQNLARLVRETELRSEVNFVGYVDDVRSWYRDCDIFVLPSRYEGISISLLEAMAEGLAVIVTRVGGNVEVVQDGVSGIVVDYDDVSGLADAIVKLCADAPLCSSLSLNAYRRVSALFNIEEAASRYIRLYRGDLP